MIVKPPDTCTHQMQMQVYSYYFEEYNKLQNE